MSRTKYYKVTTPKGVVARSTKEYFLTAVVVDGGEIVKFCRDFKMGDRVACSEMRFSRDVKVINMPVEITK